MQHNKAREVQDYMLRGLHPELPAGLSQYSLLGARGVFIRLALEDAGLTKNIKLKEEFLDMGTPSHNTGLEILAKYLEIALAC